MNETCEKINSCRTNLKRERSLTNNSVKSGVSDNSNTIKVNSISNKIEDVKTEENNIPFKVNKVNKHKYIQSNKF